MRDATLIAWHSQFGLTRGGHVDLFKRGQARKAEQTQTAYT